MVKWIKRLFCKHKWICDDSYLEKGNDGHWYAVHT